MGDLATERHKLKIMTVHKDGHILTFENFEHYEVFAGYIVRRMFEDGEVEDTTIEMERLQDHDLWVKYISELEESNDIILTEFGNCTVCRLLTQLEKEKIKSKKESEK